MVTHANLAALGAENIDGITALKAPQVKKLATAGVLPLSLFAQENLAQITADDYPGERPIVCRNPLVAQERHRKRESLLAANEELLTKVSDLSPRGPCMAKRSSASPLANVSKRTT